jgi:hypothetical protein
MTDSSDRLRAPSPTATPSSGNSAAVGLHCVGDDLGESLCGSDSSALPSLRSRPVRVVRKVWRINLHPNAFHGRVGKISEAYPA